MPDKFASGRVGLCGPGRNGHQFVKKYKSQSSSSACGKTFNESGTQTETRDGKKVFARTRNALPATKSPLFSGRSADRVGILYFVVSPNERAGAADVPFLPTDAYGGVNFPMENKSKFGSAPVRGLRRRRPYLSDGRACKDGLWGWERGGIGVGVRGGVTSSSSSRESLATVSQRPTAAVPEPNAKTHGAGGRRRRRGELGWQKPCVSCYFHSCRHYISLPATTRGLSTALFGICVIVLFSENNFRDNIRIRGYLSPVVARAIALEARLL